MSEYAASMSLRSAAVFAAVPGRSFTHFVSAFFASPQTTYARWILIHLHALSSMHRWRDPRSTEPLNRSSSVLMVAPLSENQDSFVGRFFKSNGFGGHPGSYEL
jgi:hypothetical protein